MRGIRIARKTSRWSVILLIAKFPAVRGASPIAVHWWLQVKGQWLVKAMTMCSFVSLYLIYDVSFSFMTWGWCGLGSFSLSFFLTICLPGCLCDDVTIIWPSFFFLSLFMSMSLSVFPSICLSVCWSVCLCCLRERARVSARTNAMRFHAQVVSSSFSCLCIGACEPDKSVFHSTEQEHRTD